MTLPQGYKSVKGIDTSKTILRPYQGIWQTQKLSKHMIDVHVQFITFASQTVVCTNDCGLIPHDPQG